MIRKNRYTWISEIHSVGLLVINTIMDFEDCRLRVSTLAYTDDSDDSDMIALGAELVD